MSGDRARNLPALLAFEDDMSCASAARNDVALLVWVGSDRLIIEIVELNLLASISRACYSTSNSKIGLSSFAREIVSSYIDETLNPRNSLKLSAIDA